MYLRRFVLFYDLGYYLLTRKVGISICKNSTFSDRKVWQVSGSANSALVRLPGFGSWIEVKSWIWIQIRINTIADPQTTTLIKCMWYCQQEMWWIALAILLVSLITLACCSDMRWAFHTFPIGVVKCRSGSPGVRREADPNSDPDDFVEFERTSNPSRCAVYPMKIC